MYMAFSPPVQLFFISILCGAILGIFWDVTRILKQNATSYKSVIVFILDAVFCVTACVLTLVFFFMFTYGGFRGFILAGELIGFVLYYATIEKFIFSVLKVVIEFVANILNIIFKIPNFIADTIVKILKTKMFQFLFKKQSWKSNKNDNKKIKNKKKSCFFKLYKCIIEKRFKFKRKGKFR